MSATDLIIDRADLASAWLSDPVAADIALGAGQVLVEVDEFALTTNNMSYARAGDRMGYWGFFPALDAAHGRLPVWGYATVARSEHGDVAVGEEIYGYFPVGRRLVMAPDAVTDLCWNDVIEHRQVQHPWYNRYYRTAADPVSQAGFRHLQPVLWALFMTGWEMANEIIDADGFGSATVVITSASSKTGWSLAHALGQSDLRVVGLTSAPNVAFTNSLGCYDTVATYDDFDAAGIDGPVVFVDMAGNDVLARMVHEGFGDRLLESVRIGGTHRGVGAGGPELPGPQRRFFFIPDVAENKAAAVGHAEYHAGFAAAWADFAAWSVPLLRVESSTGADAMLSAYQAMQSGITDPTLAQVFSY